MRSPARLAAALAAPALLSVPGALRAQLPNPLAPRGPRAGIMAGLSSATVGGSDAEIESGAGVVKKRRNGLVAGAYLTFPLVPGLPLALRPELLYAQKGLRISGPDYSVYALDAQNQTSAVGTINAALKVDYLALPVLLQLDVPSAAGLRPSLYAGPSVAYRVQCRVETESGGTTESVGCADADAVNRKFDVSGVVGGQLGFGLAGQAIGVGVRYTHGFTNLVRDANVKNRAFAVYGAIEFGR